MRLPWKRAQSPDMIEYTSITIFDGKAFLPVQGKSDLIGFVETEPVVTCELTPESLTVALEEIVRRGNPPTRHPSAAQQRQQTPLEKATGLRGWKRLARASAMKAGISWVRDEGRVKIAFSPRGAKDNLNEDYSNRKEFPIDTPLRVLAKCILDEWRDRQTTKAEPST